MEKRCNKCGNMAHSLCAGCKLVYYCGRAHQQEDWEYHKAFCLMSRQKAKPLIQENTPKDECVGTFRWADNDGLPPLPAFPSSPPALSNWNEYLSARVPTIDSVVPQFIDALSYPVSFLYCLQEAGITLTANSQNVLIVGASERAEERLSVATNYFQDIAHYHSQVTRWKLFFAGPEISTTRHNSTARLSANMDAEYYRGTVGELMSEHYGEFTSENTVIVGFNTGFGSGYLPLMSSWVHDLITILNLKLPTFFTCANDYGDLRGERLVLEEVLGPKYVLEPRQNPLSALSTLHPPGGRETAWTRSSSFVYGIRGYRDGALGPIIPRQQKAAIAQKLQQLSALLSP